MLELLIDEIEQISGKKVVSIIGAGGKTTLMYTLAEAFAKKGYKTLATTTTHIYEPDEGIYVENLEALSHRWSRNEYGVVGQRTKADKLKALPRDVLFPYMEQAEVILIEADGAKGMPCKVSNTTEPVILPETNMVMMVLGLDAWGKRMRDVCFRCELAMDLLEEDRDHVMNESDFIAIIKNQLEEQLQLSVEKYHVVLNKCDHKKQRIMGERIKKQLEQDEKYQVYLTSMI